MQLDLFQLETAESCASETLSLSHFDAEKAPFSAPAIEADELLGDAHSDALQQLSPPIPGSSCLLCQAQGLPEAFMVKHHPDLAVWRCQRHFVHRFWLSREQKPDGKRGKAIGVWLGHSRKDPGSGPGPIPDWAID